MGQDPGVPEGMGFQTSKEHAGLSQWRTPDFQKGGGRLFRGLIHCPYQGGVKTRVKKKSKRKKKKKEWKKRSGKGNKVRQ